MLGTLELVFYGVNETICVKYFKAVDMGGSMYVHCFGAYFGVAAAFFFCSKRAIADKEERGEGSYHS